MIIQMFSEKIFCIFALQKPYCYRCLEDGEEIDEDDFVVMEGEASSLEGETTTTTTSPTQKEPTVSESKVSKPEPSKSSEKVVQEKPTCVVPKEEKKEETKLTKEEIDAVTKQVEEEMKAEVEYKKPKPFPSFYVPVRTISLYSDKKEELRNYIIQNSTDNKGDLNSNVQFR